ncbi:hypothetical protein COOONC_16362 [Cooperia oncophora]
MDHSVLNNWTQCKLDIVTDYPKASANIITCVLNTTAWGKGVAILNGNNLGRYWASQGPQYTLYVPAAFLRAGDNSLLLLELEGTRNCNDSSCFMSFVEQPIFKWETTTAGKDSTFGRKHHIVLPD